MKQLLFFIILITSFQCFGQQALSTMARSQYPNMMVTSNAQRYMRYQYMTDWVGLYGDSLNILNPYWLGSILPNKNVLIDANNKNFIISNGNIGSFATDTSSNGWILQYYVSKLLSDGVGKIGGRNYLTGKTYGLDFNGATGTVLSGNVNVTIANEQVQDGELSPDSTYVATVDENGVIDFVEQSTVGTWLKPQLEAGDNVEIKVDNSYLKIESVDNEIIVEIDPSQSGSFGEPLSVYSQDVSESTYLEPGFFRATTNSLSVKAAMQLRTNNSGAGVERMQINSSQIGMVVARDTANGQIFFNTSAGTITSPTNISNGRKLGEINYQGYQNAAYRTAVNIKAVAKNVSGSVVNADLTYSNNANQEVFKIDLSPTRNIEMAGYPNTRDDAGIATNIISTSSTGVMESRTMNKVFPMFTTQNTNLAFTGGGSLQDVGNLQDVTNENTAVYSSTATTITFLEPGVYDMTFSGTIISDDVIAAGDEWQVTYNSTGSIAPVIYESAQNFPIGDLNRVYFNQTYKIRVADNSTITPRFLSDTTTDAGTLGFTITIIKVN